MNTMVKRIASWFVPATIALAICPTAAIAEGPQSEATAADTDQIEQTQDVAANSASTNIIQTQGPDGTDPIGGTSDAQNSGQQPTEQVNNGLVLENGHLINYADGTEKAISGWRQYNGYWYWFADSPKASESEWITTNDKQYRLGSDGKMLSGTFSIDGSLYHAPASGAIITGGCWVKSDGKWWYPNRNGELYIGWLHVDGCWYWLDRDSGAMQTGWVQDNDGEWYLMDESGSMLTGWQKKGAWYHLAPSGAMETGWLRSGGSWYWLDRDSGAMQTGWIGDNDGKWWFAEGSGALATSARWVMGNGGSWYRIDGDGAMATGWRYVSGCWYWLDPSLNGEMAANKLVNDNGTYYWCDSSGAMIRNSWCKDGAWYWASDSGAMASGWIKTGGSWYWLDPSNPKHPMLTGLQAINGSDYFFKDSGAMASSCWVDVASDGIARFASSSGALGSITRDSDGVLTNNGSPCSGWVDLGGAKTYVDPVSHKVKTGWIEEESSYYYISPASGIAATGWEKVSGTWYLFDNSGKMLTDWQNIGGTWYYMNSSGAMQTGWLHLGSTWYWLDGSGAMATGWRSIGGTWYYFNGSGAWVENPERSQMTDRIYGYSSGTQWLIAVNRSTHKVGIFKGSARNWSLQYYLDCVTGAPSSPTITGSFRTTGGKRMALSTDSRARWCTQISGGYFFHTILASNNELGKSLSHGCIRMAYPDAQWIYNNIYAGTAVVIYG